MFLIKAVFKKLKIKEEFYSNVSRSFIINDNKQNLYQNVKLDETFNIEITSRYKIFFRCKPVIYLIGFSSTLYDIFQNEKVSPIVNGEITYIKVRSDAFSAFSVKIYIKRRQNIAKDNYDISSEIRERVKDDIKKVFSVISF
ncbi:MAG: hypothetical protein RMJ67_01080 [Elusimicrobiota bacterium]|nr:hypothetical protein [Endomicrobiia bacterium]MDW8165096.1 hypothetical protein [Elusimicrobiota bacterium]